MNKILAIEVSAPGINVALVDLNAKAVVPGSAVFELIDTHDSAENIISGWAAVIRKCATINDHSISRIAIGIVGPCDYEKGISLMKNQNKFEALYQLNIKELLAQKLEISTDYIKMKNNTASLLQGEVLSGCAQGYANVLAFTLNLGFGTAWYHDGKSEDMNLWNKPFLSGIAEDYLGISWLLNRYAEFKMTKLNTIHELTSLAEHDDGIIQLVFNEYGENFVKFLFQQIIDFKPELIIVGGNNNAWSFFVSYVKDRLGDKNYSTPVKLATLKTDATLIGAAHEWIADDSVKHAFLDNPQLLSKN